MSKVKTLSMNWEPTQWTYEAESGVEILCTDMTASHCFEFEERAGKVGNDAASDWLLSQFCLIEGSPVGIDSPLSVFDRMNLLSLLRGYEKEFEYLDGLDPLKSNYFRHTESGLNFKFESPPMSFRVSQVLEEKGQAGLVMLLAKEYTFVDNFRLADTDLSRFSYCAGDIACRHFAGKVSRLPKKKPLSKQ